MSDSQNEFTFEFDLDSDEIRRRAEMVRVLGDDWDPVAVIEGEQAAYDLLYSGLDAQQQAIYQQLVHAGVLPERETGSDAA